MTLLGVSGSLVGSLLCFIKVCNFKSRRLQFYIPSRDASLVSFSHVEFRISSLNVCCSHCLLRISVLLGKGKRRTITRGFGGVYISSVIYKPSPCIPIVVLYVCQRTGKKMLHRLGWLEHKSLDKCRNYSQWSQSWITRQTRFNRFNHNSWQALSNSFNHSSLG